jgi:hypothetical protein
MTRENAMNTRVCLCLLTLLLSIQLHAAKKQEAVSKHWIAQYKGSGTLKMLEGYIIRIKSEYDAGGNFTGFSHIYSPSIFHMFGVSNASVIFLVENSDEKGVLKIKPRKGVESYTQFFQIIGSNSHFKTIKISVVKDNTHLTFTPSQAVFIDGNVQSFMSKMRLIAMRMYFRNVERFTVPGMYASELYTGRLSLKIPNGYMDREGDSNDVIRLTEGNISKLTVKNAIHDSSIYAGASYFDVYTKDLAGLYAAYPPGGTIGMVKARLISGSGEMGAFWAPTTVIAAASRPKLKVPSGQVITETTSVFITP